MNKKYQVTIIDGSHLISNKLIRFILSRSGAFPYSTVILSYLISFLFSYTIAEADLDKPIVNLKH
jgi:hypothetical protein